MTTMMTKVRMLTDTEMIINRVFDASPELVYKAWTDPALMARWWGPQEFTSSVCKMDVRPGGAYRIVMRSPEGKDYPTVGTYQEVVENERLIFSDTFDELPQEWLDELRSHLPPGASKSIPPDIVTANFEEQDGKTLLTVTSRFESKALRDAIVQMGVAEVWAQSLDKLEELLAMIS